MWEGLIGAGVNAGLGAYNNAQNIGMQRETNSLNYQMWQKQMDYDRPINQVARLKEAGLNPALMYGTGSGANVAPNAPKLEAPQGSPIKFDPGAAVAVQQARLLGEQTRALKLENDQTESVPGARRGDTAPVRAIRGLWDSFKESDIGKHTGPTLRAMGARGLSGVLGDAYKYWSGSRPQISEKKADASSWKRGPNPNW